MTVETETLRSPFLPYNGTSGHSGSDTSRARAVTNDSDGTTLIRQQQALNLLQARRFDGVTWEELGSRLNVHHGTASGILSVLHKTGQIERLSDTRHGSKVYVLPEFVWNRQTESHGRKRRPIDVTLKEWLTVPEGKRYSKAREYPRLFVTAIEHAWKSEQR